MILYDPDPRPRQKRHKVFFAFYAGSLVARVAYEAGRAEQFRQFSRGKVDFVQFIGRKS